MSFKKQVSNHVKYFQNEKQYVLLFWVRCSDQDLEMGKDSLKEGLWKYSDLSGLDCSLELQWKTVTGFSCTRELLWEASQCKSC